MPILWNIYDIMSLFAFLLNKKGLIALSKNWLCQKSKQTVVNVEFTWSWNCSRLTPLKCKTVWHKISEPYFLDIFDKSDGEDFKRQKFSHTDLTRFLAIGLSTLDWSIFFCLESQMCFNFTWNSIKNCN